jgi:hypothetical protein
MDPDMAEAPIENYLLLSAPASGQMLEPRMGEAADFVAALCRRAPALVLCEAGVTRSVYFCVLVVARRLGLPGPEALAYVTGRLGRVRLKGFMLDRLRGGLRGRQWGATKTPAGGRGRG